MRHLFFGILLLALTLPSVASAGVLTGSLSNLKQAGVSYGEVTAGQEASTLQQMVGRIINAFLSLLGTIFLGYLLYGGYRWFTAAGNEEEVKKAKDIIRQAIIGLAIIMAAGAISYFVTVSLEGATVTQ